MNKEEIEFLTANSLDLINKTNVSSQLLVLLQINKLLNDEEAQDLRNNKSKFDQSMELYNTLKTKTGAFEILKHVLKETYQSGAVEILDKFVQTKTGIRPSQFPLFQRDTDRELTESQIRLIASILSNSGMVWSSWSQVLAELGVKNYDVFISSLRPWQKNNPNEATLENFLRSLQAAGLNNTADAIAAKLG